MWGGRSGMGIQGNTWVPTFTRMAVPPPHDTGAASPPHDVYMHARDVGAVAHPCVYIYTRMDEPPLPIPLPSPRPLPASIFSILDGGTGSKKSMLEEVWARVSTSTVEIACMRARVAPRLFRVACIAAGSCGEVMEGCTVCDCMCLKCFQRLRV